MENNISFIDYHSNDFYFLYLNRSAEEGITGDKWQEHSFYEIMLICDGESDYVIENRRYETKKGDVLLIKPGKYHFKEWINKGPISIFCLGFLPEAISNAGLAEEIFKRTEFFSIDDDSPILEAFSLMKKKLALSKKNFSLFIKSLSEAIVLLLSDIIIGVEKQEEIKNTAVRKMINYINENLCDVKNVDDVARALFFSESYTRTLFKKEMGIGIMEYVRNKKVLLAQRKIRHGKKPTEIYAECGFSNYPSFYRAYVAFFGKPPKSVRNS